MVYHSSLVPFRTSVKLFFRLNFFRRWIIIITLLCIHFTHIPKNKLNGVLVFLGNVYGSIIQLVFIWYLLWVYKSREHLQYFNCPRLSRTNLSRGKRLWTFEDNIIWLLSSLYILLVSIGNIDCSIWRLMFLWWFLWVKI